MTAKVLRGPGAAKYLGLANQRLGALKATGGGVQVLNVGDAQINVSAGPGGERIIIDVDPVTLVVSHRKAITMELIGPPSYLFTADIRLRGAGLRRAGGPIPAKALAPSLIYNSAAKLTGAGRRFLTTVFDTSKLHYFEGSGWGTIYPALIDARTGETQLFLDADPLVLMGFDEYPRNYGLVHIGVDAVGDEWAVLAAYNAPYDLAGAIYCPLAKLNLTAGTSSWIWPIYGGYTAGISNSLVAIGRGKIAFLVNFALVIGDVFAGTWAITDATTLGLTTLATNLSYVVSPADGTLVLIMYDIPDPVPDPLVTRQRFFRSTNGGTGWTEITEDIPVNTVDWIVSAVSTPAPGVVVMQLQGYVTPSQKTLVVSTDGGVTWVEAARKYDPARVVPILHDGTKPVFYGVAAGPAEYTYTYGGTAPDKDVPIYVEVYRDYRCIGDPLWKVPAGLGNLHAPYPTTDLGIEPQLCLSGGDAPLFPGHPGRLEAP